MQTMTGVLAMALLPVALGLSAAAMSNATSDGKAVPASPNTTAPAVEAPLRCQIDARHGPDGMVVLEGRAHAQGPVTGTYRLHVRRSGNGAATIVQNGAFRAAPDAPAELGTVSLGGGGHYTAELEATADDGAACADRAQGPL